MFITCSSFLFELWISYTVSMLSLIVAPLCWQEVDVLSKLEHPNIVRYYGSSIVSTINFLDPFLCKYHLLSTSKSTFVCSYVVLKQEDGHLCIFLELVRMGSLDTNLKKYNRFEDKTIRRYTWQILCGLDYLHAKATIHRWDEVFVIMIFEIMYLWLSLFLLNGAFFFLF